MRFFLHYLARPRFVGAVAPSSRFLARKMVKPIDFEKARCVVEFGPGTGVFTDEILRRRRAETVVVAIERDAHFSALLQKKYAGMENVHIINGSAEHVGVYLAQREIAQADYIVSGLPFASLPPEASQRILTQARAFLHKDGRFVTFQYSMYRRAFIAGFFDSIEITREFRNLPPAYVFSCSYN
ncbi:MAG: methyltransferase domain-containing protein [Defluviitaleaceae bacterium]|nr:methyltransferase domain-containing protein [Defluviitaleaceae bacterium]MCL2240765.1 methyltransferase domain-containing protein [Defluviitaleaceae bacterium]